MLKEYDNRAKPRPRTPLASSVSFTNDTAVVSTDTETAKACVDALYALVNAVDLAGIVMTDPRDPAKTAVCDVERLNLTELAKAYQLACRVLGRQPLWGSQRHSEGRS